MKLLTGQVSKLFGISKDTLRHYDKIGLLKPDVNKSNGYRYYSEAHLEQLTLILSSKDLGISLSDIKYTIDTENIHEYKKLVNKQEQLIAEQIEILKVKQSHLIKFDAVLEEIIDYENEYDFSKLQIKDIDLILYGVHIDKALENNNAHTYIDLVNENLLLTDNALDYIQYIAKEDGSIYENEEYMFIREYEENKELINRYINKGVALDKISLNGKFVKSKFYGKMNEVKDYIKLLNNYFNKNLSSDIFISFDFYMPKKHRNEEYFIEILLNVK